ncbi:MAG TPA: SDR family NAD(P)-dependent oxidoreductase [Candidatus Lokiarchaeia archaeon]|nr:SDR family NAD(P)-dependent oxidoreductase [Candidatus Lokiarchaeia archaeon]
MTEIKNFMGWDSPGVALVTGASSGIGAEFARQLAVQGFSTILVARRKERLDDLASSLSSDFSGEHEVLVADLSTNAGIEAVEQRIAIAGNLDVLVNNAGFGTIGKFQDVEMGSQLDMLSVHVLAPVRFMKAALPAMVDRKRGVIINVASLAAFAWGGGHAMYCATKAFLRAFSESLATDLQGTGVRVQALCPGFVNTEFGETGFHRSTISEDIYMSTERVVAASLDAFQKKFISVVPGEAYQELAKGALKHQIHDLDKASKKK